MKQVKENKLILFNEAVTLGISYLFMVINGICYSEQQYVTAGRQMKQVLYVDWIVNALVILNTTLKEVSFKCKRCHA